MEQAFVLGAGLGKRLRPLTDSLPKPLVPVLHRPLIERAFDHLNGVGIDKFVVNTHHLPEAYTTAYPSAEYRGSPIAFRNEPILLETGGGIANVADLLGDEPFIVYNGDILTDLPLAPAIEAHREAATRGRLVTMVLRSQGHALQVAIDEASNAVIDIGDRLGRAGGTHQFTGIYLVEPGFHDFLQTGVKESVIAGFLRAMGKGDEKVGSIVLDSGSWEDLGTPESYIDANLAASLADPDSAVHPEADVDSTADLSGGTVIGAGAYVAEGTVLDSCVIWPGAHVAPGSFLTRCVVRGGEAARGLHNDTCI